MARFQKENVPPTTISFQINDNEFDDLQERIDEFKKQNPEELDELCKFVDDVIKEANTKVAEKRNSVSLMFYGGQMGFVNSIYYPLSHTQMAHKFSKLIQLLVQLLLIYGCSKSKNVFGSFFSLKIYYRRFPNSKPLFTQSSCTDDFSLFLIQLLSKD